MKTFALFVTLALAIGSAQAALLPGDAAKGKVVQEKHCSTCHDTGMYMRADRKVKSVEALIGRVNGCVRQTGAKLDRDQINDLVKYLDESFYKFK